MNQPPKREGFVQDEPIDPPITAEVVPQDDVKIDEWPIVVKLLYKRIKNNKGDLIDILSFREPTGGDINRHGNPCRIDQTGEVIIDDRRMMAVMASLSGVLQPFLEAMDPRDYNSCAYRLRNFFLPNTAAW